MERSWFSAILLIFLMGCQKQNITGVFLDGRSPVLPGSSPSDPVTLELFNLTTTNITTTGFDVQVSFSGDANSNSSVALYYCNETSSPGCDPMAGFSVDMFCVGSLCSYALDGLATNGSTYKVAIAATDVDGVFGLPLTESVSLTAGTLQIFRSVGYANTSALATGAGNNLTILNSVATFSVALPDNIGVGDALQYDANNDGIIDSVVFIYNRISSTQFTVSTVGGLAVGDLSLADQDWSVFRAYTSLKLAEDGTENTGLDDAIENFDTWSGGRDLVANTEQWNIAYYADAVEPGDNLVVLGWVTSANEFLRFFVPSRSTEVGQSQRHQGRLDRSKALLSLTFDSAFEIGINHVRVEGFQVFATSLNSNEAMIEVGNPTGLDATGEVHVSNNLLIYRGPAVTGGTVAGVTGFIANDPNSRLYLYNNIISYDAADVTSGFLIRSGRAFLYNNTILSSYRGISVESGATILAKNNVVSGTASSAYRNAGGNWDANSNNNISDDASNTGGSNDLINTTIKFVNSNIYDFRLDGASYAAKGTGQDLALDSVLPLTSDIRGEVRSRWDRGANSLPNAIFRSIGKNSTSALTTGAGNDLNIVVNSLGHTIGNFGSGLPGNVGVGDAIEFDSDANASIDKIAFISERISSTSFILKGADGENTVTLGSPTQNWNVFRSYVSMSDAVGGSENPGLDNAVEDFDTWSGGKDLVASGEQWNFSLYADGPFSTRTNLSSPWNSSSFSNIRIFAPYRSDQVGYSQRHEGVWDNYKATINLNGANNDTININVPFVSVEGLLIEPSDSSFQDGIFIRNNTDGTVIKNNILRSPSGASADRSAIVISTNGGGATNTYIINNIIYGFNPARGIYLFNEDSTDFLYIYNNTVVGNSVGMSTGSSTGTVVIKNNIAVLNSVDFSLGPVTSSNNISLDATSPDGAGLQNKTVGFFSASINDFRLSSTDTSALGLAADLSEDESYNFSDDARTIARAGWDIGALSYVNYSAILTGYDDLGEGTSVNPYIITNETQLEQIGSNCGGGFSTTCGYVVQIVENIDMTGVSFSPIGDSVNPFTGTINCGLRAINNLTINTPGSSYVGFIGAMSGAELAECNFDLGNITGNGYVGLVVGDMGTGSLLRDVSGSNFSVVGSSLYVGGIVGHILDAGTLTDVTAQGSVTSSANDVGGVIGFAHSTTLTGVGSVTNVIGSSYVGGVVGEGLDLNLSTTSASGTVSGVSYVGGAAGVLGGPGSITSDLIVVNSRVSASNDYVGGLAGVVSHSLTNSRSEGTVSGVSYVGGLIGALSETDGGTESLVNTYSLSDVFASGTNSGGLVGQSDTEYSIQNSWAGGDVRGTGSLGGLIGTNYANLADCAARGRTESHVSGASVGGLVGYQAAGLIERCQATGDVVSLAVGGEARAGGFVGYLVGGSNVENSFSVGNVYGAGAAIGGFIGKADTTPQSINLCYSSGNVISESNEVGGFIGHQEFVSINESYSKGNVVGVSDVGGFVGNATSGSISDSYTKENKVSGADVGGFGGSTSATNISNSYAATEIFGSVTEFSFINNLSGGTLSNNYWDSNLSSGNGSSSSASVGGSYEGLTGSQFLDDANFDSGQSGNWDYTTKWTQLDGRGYPLHKNSVEGQCVANPTAQLFNSIGSGTASSPFVLCNRSQFLDFGDNGCDAPGQTANCSSVYAMGADIDLKSTSINLIGGSSDPFSGVFDGRFHKLKNYKYENPGAIRVALFQGLSGTIQNLYLENMISHISYNTSTLVNYIISNAKILDVDSMGSLSGTFGISGFTADSIVTTAFEQSLLYKSVFTGDLTGDRGSAGLLTHTNPQQALYKSSSYVDMNFTSYIVGGASESAVQNIKKVKTTGTLVGSASSLRMGGIVGMGGNYARVLDQVYSSLDISAGDENFGGLSGEGDLSIVNSYSSGSVLDGMGTGDRIGGLAGVDANISYSYADNKIQNYNSNVGGIYGRDTWSSSIVDNFWNTQFITDGSGPSTTGNKAGKYTGLSGAQNLAETNYSNWDFSKVWAIGEGVRPPILRWMLHPICQANMTAVNYSDIGSGTKVDPYKICFVEQLEDLGANGCDGDSSGGCASHYLLMNDLDAKGALITPIGALANPFTGSFDGQNNTIANISISNSEITYQGLFGFSSGRIENIHLALLNIVGGQFTGGLVGYNSGVIKNSRTQGTVFGSGEVGGFVGKSVGSIQESYAKVTVVSEGVNMGGFAGSAETGSILKSGAGGSVTSNVSGSNLAIYIGGFVGKLENGATVIDSWATGDVDASANGYAGGFVGNMTTSSFVRRSEAHGNVVSDYGRAGGFVGSLADASIQESFSLGSVGLKATLTGNYYGGFAGRANVATASIVHCYTKALTVESTSTTNHPFAAQADPSATLTNNYWDADLGGVSDPGRMEPLADLNFDDQTSFVGWDFINTWRDSDSPPDFLPSN